MSVEKSRRAFLADCGKMISSAALAAIVIPVLQSCEPTSIPSITEPITQPTDPDGRIGVDVSDLSDEKPLKQAPGLKGSDGKGVLVTRVSDTEFYALSMRCTHEGNPISSTLDEGEIVCPFHLSKFNLKGEVQSGPAPASLKRYDAIFDEATKQLRIKLS